MTPLYLRQLPHHLSYIHSSDRLHLQSTAKALRVYAQRNARPLYPSKQLTASRTIKQVLPMIAFRVWNGEPFGGKGDHLPWGNRSHHLQFDIGVPNTKDWLYNKIWGGGVAVTTLRISLKYVRQLNDHSYQQ